MMKFHKLALVLVGFTLLGLEPAYAVCTGQFTGGTVCGNTGTTTGNPSETSTPTLGIPGSVAGSLAISGATSGKATIVVPAVAGTPTLTLPTTTDTLVGVATTNALINKTYNGLTIPTTTGTLSIANSSTLATAGAFSSTLTFVGASNVTLPLSGTLQGAAINIAALKALSASNNTVQYVAGYYNPGDGGGGVFTYDASSMATDDGGSVIAPNSGVGRWLRSIYDARVDVRGWGAVCGSGDSTTPVLAAIVALFAQATQGGTLVIPCLITMNGALAIPFTGTAPPQQPPLRITGLGPPSWDSTLFGRSPPGGGILNLLYNGMDGLHPAKIDTRGIGILEIDHLKIEDTAGTNFLMLQSTNTTIRSHDNHWTGNTSCVAPACSQDILQFGGITNASATVGTAAATAGFQGIGTSSINDTFSYCRHAINFGGSANAITVVNLITDYTCGSAEVTGAPLVFYGVGLQTIGNTIYGGVVEMSHYPYAVAFRDNASGCTSGGSYKNSIIGLGAYDEGGGTLGYAYFQSTCDQSNLIQPGYANVGSNLLTGPGAAGQLLLVPGGGLLSALPYFSDGLGVAKTLGSTGILAFGTPGTAAARLLSYGINDGGTGVGVLGPAGNTVNGIVGNLWELDYFGVAARAAIDQAGNLGVGGTMTATGYKAGVSVGVDCNAGISATTGRSVKGIITAC